MHKDAGVLEVEAVQLRRIISDTLWMARRYADGRSTYATTDLNRAIEAALRLGIQIEPDPALDGRIFVNDGMYGRWDPEQSRFVKGSHGT